MMRRWCRLLVILNLCFLPGVLWAQAKVGTAGMQFLKIGPSARAVGMGESFLAVADDATAIYYNPAGLIQLGDPDLLFTHIEYPVGLSFEHIAFAYPVPAMGVVVGASVSMLLAGDMIETTTERPNGTGRTFSASDFAGGITYCQRLTDKFSVGGTFKYLQENLADKVAKGWAADVGTFYDTGWRSIKMAMIISNFGPDIKFVDSPFPLPMNFKFGASMLLFNAPPNRIIFALEGSHPNDNMEMLNFGLEYAFKDMVFLRAGKKVNGLRRYSWNAVKGEEAEGVATEKSPYIEYPLYDEEGRLAFDGFSFGGGVKFPGMSLKVDYAFAAIRYLGHIHRFSLGSQF